LLPTSCSVYFHYCDSPCKRVFLFSSTPQPHHKVKAYTVVCPYLLRGSWRLPVMDSNINKWLNSQFLINLNFWYNWWFNTSINRERKPIIKSVTSAESGMRFCTRFIWAKIMTFIIHMKPASILHAYHV
jgi:hypothetical protein